MTLLGNLAATYSALGRHEDALRVKERVAAAGLRVLGEDHPDYLTSLNNLASTYSALGRHEDALRVMERVAAARLRVLGEDHPDYLIPHPRRHTDPAQGGHTSCSDAMPVRTQEQ